MPLTEYDLEQDCLYRLIRNNFIQGTRHFSNVTFDVQSSEQKRLAAKLKLNYWTERLSDYIKLMNEKHDKRPIEDKFNETL